MTAYADAFKEKCLFFLKKIQIAKWLIILKENKILKLFLLYWSWFVIKNIRDSAASGALSRHKYINEHTINKKSSIIQGTC